MRLLSQPITKNKEGVTAHDPLLTERALRESEQYQLGQKLYVQARAAAREISDKICVRRHPFIGGQYGIFVGIRNETAPERCAPEPFKPFSGGKPLVQMYVDMSKKEREIALLYGNQLLKILGAEDFPDDCGACCGLGGYFEKRHPEKVLTAFASILSNEMLKLKLDEDSEKRRESMDGITTQITKVLVKQIVRVRNFSGMRGG